jgi:hypothetical protein
MHLIDACVLSITLRQSIQAFFNGLGFLDSGILPTQWPTDSGSAFHSGADILKEDIRRCKMPRGRFQLKWTAQESQNTMITTA